MTKLTDQLLEKYSVEYFEQKILEYEKTPKPKWVCFDTTDPDYKNQISSALISCQIIRELRTADFIAFCLLERTDLPDLISKK
jgi:hypothetical protein